MLGKWGPNRAADPIVTRWKPGDKRKLQIVAIQRGDTGVWALPGGMVDAGEVVSVTVRREFAEEAGNMASDAERAAFNAAVDELFAHGEVVYRGYVDDPRNTDNAWMETTAFHFHCTADLAVQLPLRAGDDAHNVTWLDVDDAEPRYAALYASHKDWVGRVACELSASGLAAAACEQAAAAEVMGEEAAAEAGVAASLDALSRSSTFERELDEQAEAEAARGPLLGLALRRCKSSPTPGVAAVVPLGLEEALRSVGPLVRPARPARPVRPPARPVGVVVCVT